MAWEENIPIESTSEHQERLNLREYQAMLLMENTTIPFTLKDGWMGEDAMTKWPSLYFSDITDYLKLRTSSELYQKLCNEYKLGKAYR